MADDSSFDDLSSFDCDSPTRRASIDIEVQRSLVAEDRWRDHAVWCERHNEATQLSIHNRRIALKILVAEACRRDTKYAEKQGLDAGQIVREWRQIADDAMEEMRVGDNSMSVLRKLSSMSVFIEGNVCRQYGENVEGRTRRLETQHSLINRLRRGNSLFTAPPIAGPGATSCGHEEKAMWTARFEKPQRDVM